MFGLIDCNNFFVSCERVFNPSLCNKPLVVLSNNDGCVISRSNEAKVIGIPMGIPVFKIRELIKRHQVEIRSCNHTLYSDMSRRVMNILAQEAPQLEIYSVDEAFIDLHGLPDIKIFGHKLVQKIFRWTGIPVSLGIAKTKTLAKLASHYAKKNPSTQGLYIWNEEDIQKMWEIPVNEVWGIGRRYSRMLENNGKHTVLDFYNSSRSWVKHFMTIQGERTWQELHGEACLQLEDINEPQKSICISRSFGEPITTIEIMEEAITQFTSGCALKLRNQNSLTASMQIFIRTNRFTETEYKGDNIQISFHTPTNATAELVSQAHKGLMKIFRQGEKYKRAGVILYNFSKPTAIQGDLFEKTNRTKQNKLQTAIDGINQKIGKDKIRLAIQGNGTGWKAKKEHLSPDYTTDLNDIIVLNV